MIRMLNNLSLHFHVGDASGDAAGDASGDALGDNNNRYCYLIRRLTRRMTHRMLCRMTCRVKYFLSYVCLSRNSKTPYSSANEGINAALLIILLSKYKDKRGQQ